MDSAADNRIRFNGFEFRTDAEQLFRRGVLVELQPKPAAILALLLERPSELVTREEIARRIWPDRIVDFDQRISTSIKQVRRALGDDPAKPIYIETVPRKGYRFIAPVESGSEAGSIKTASLFHLSGGAGRATGIALAVMALAFIAVFYAALKPQVNRATRTETGVSRQLLLVLPGIAENEDDIALATGLTEEILARLTRIRPQTLGVIARTTARQFDDTPRSLDRAQKELNVAYVLETAIRGNGTEKQATLDLVRLGDKTQLWSDAYNLSTDDWVSVRDGVARHVAQALQLRLSRAMTEDNAARLVNSKAFNTYLTGRSYLSRFGSQGLQQATRYFEQAIAADSQFAPAYAALASAYMSQPGKLAQARVVLDRALTLDPELAAAYEVLGEMRLWHDKDFDGARAALERALELEPGRSSARIAYANYLSVTSQAGEAIRQAAMARKLDPLSAAVFGRMGWVYLYANRPDLAIPECERALELNLGNAYYALIANDCLVHAHNQLGNRSATIEPMLRVMKLYGTGDPREEQIKTVDSLEEKARIYWSWRIDAMSRFSAYVDAAKAYMELGDYEGALTSLEQALEKNSGGLAFLNVDPAWKPLRKMPRFQRIVHGVFAEK